MSLELLRRRMAWPEAADLLAPEGAGPRVLADLANEKIEKTIRRELAAETSLRVGILTKSPSSGESQSPIAVACEFGRPVEPRTLALAHRLAWNFARSPLLVTIEPHLVIVTLRPIEPDDQPLVYISPKQVTPAGGAEVTESSYAILIEPHDVAQVWPAEAARQPFVWTALAWGGRRDYALIRRFTEANSIQKMMDSGIVTSREGIIRGRFEYTGILGWRILEDDDFPPGIVMRLPVQSLPVNENPYTHRQTDREAFQLPQLVIKQGWRSQTGRFRAVLCEGPGARGALCSQSYLSVHAAEQDARWLESAALCYNSAVAVYYLLLTSGRLASYRPEPLVEEIRSVPLPQLTEHPLLDACVFGDVDEQVRKAFGLKDAEWAVIQDLVAYTMADFQGDANSPGRHATLRSGDRGTIAGMEPMLTPYCEYFLRVLKAGFGQEKPVCATIYQDALDARLPVRIVAIHLDLGRDEPVAVERIDSADLCELLLELDEKFLRTPDGRRGGIFVQRTARVYDEVQICGRRVPTIYVVKPDRVRYWTRSAALRDADEVAADLASWQSAARGHASGRKEDDPSHLFSAPLARYPRIGQPLLPHRHFVNRTHCISQHRRRTDE